MSSKTKPALAYHATSKTARAGMSQHLQSALSLARASFKARPEEVHTRLKRVETRLQRALKISRTSDAGQNFPIRTVHHLSCTGGTLITKCIASMANVLVLNEIDMHSPMSNSSEQDPVFSPTDLIALLRQGDPELSSDLVSELFRSDLEVIRRNQSSIGRDLVLRDHSHSHFLTGPEIPDRPTLLENARRVGPTISLVTVRNPVHSFASMTLNGWHKDFSPGTFDEYCRRYLAFLDAHEDIPWIKYESFVSAPHETMRQICQILELTYFEGFEDVYGAFRFSGDSGRRNSEKISRRPDRKITSELQTEVMESNYYAVLAARLDYQSTMTEQ